MQEWEIKQNNQIICWLFNKEQETGSYITHSLDTSQGLTFLKPLEGNSAPAYHNYKVFQYDSVRFLTQEFKELMYQANSSISHY